ncbi:unnamed protein product [Didymodactylos carnosus]|uniref:7-dehydrocholesterol reductase n=1 Tax=Didymodactylos carnosus TaxID=1234261 RepID=A0A8S2G5N0_9BILA|nr:unnamed protein product [Didymodactylos carnosus]
MSIKNTKLSAKNDIFLRKKAGTISDENDLSSPNVLETKEPHLLSVHHRRGQNKFIFECIIPLLLCLFCPQLFTEMTLKQVLENFFYFQWHWPSAFIFFSFISYSILMTLILPGEIYQGPITDNGHIPEYKNNGFSYYLISLGLFMLITSGLKLFGLTPTYIYDNFEQFLSTLSTFAFVFCFFLMLKGKNDITSPPQYNA